MKLLIFLISLAIFKSSNGQIEYDHSMEEFCKRHNGVFKKRENDGSGKGDTCTAIFNVVVTDKDEAMEFCNMWSPYHVESATRLNNFQTNCEMTAFRFCENGRWKLIWDRCFSLVSSTPMNRTEATKLCGQHGAHIFRLDVSRLTRMLKYVYPRVAKFWTEIDGTTKILVFGQASAIYGGRGTQVFEGDAEDVAYPLCEYTPPSGRPFLRHYMNILSEVYYPSLVTNGSLLFRTSNFYGHRKFIDNTNDAYTDDKNCESILRVLRIPETRHSLQSGIFEIPTFTKELRDTLVLAHNNAIRRFKLDENCGKIHEKRDFMHYYTRYKQYGRIKEDHWRRGSPTGNCPRQSSTVLLHHTDKNVVVSDVSTALTAPMWCGFETLFNPKFTCPQGYSLYKRATGEHVCFGLSEQLENWLTTNFICQHTAKGFLAGFETEEEYRLFVEMHKGIEKKRKRQTRVWLGGHRSVDCLWEGPRDKKGFATSGLCTREKVFHWQNNVADNEHSVIYKYFVNQIEPNYLRGDEKCLEMRSDIHEFNRLNDVSCERRGYGICQTRPFVVFDQLGPTV